MWKVEGQGLGWALGGFLAGTLWQLQQAALWPRAWSVAWVALAGAGLAAWAWRRGRAEASSWISRLVWALLAGWLAASVADLRAHGRLDDRLAPALEGQDLELVGVIASLPQWREGSARFHFDVESARPAFAGEDEQAQPPGVAGVPTRVLLTWGGGFADGALQRLPPEDLQAGQCWRFVVRLRRPHGSFNPHGFDVELWLFENGLGATGSVRSLRSQRHEWLGVAPGYPVQRARQAVADAIRARVPDARSAGVLAALVVGEQSAIDRADWDLFRITGVSHLMAISGLHVTMFAWLAAGVLRRLWHRRQGWMLALPAPVAARWGGLVLALGYAVFSGWGVPSQRTVWMLATVAVLAQIGRRWPWGLMLLCTATVVAAVDPWALLAPGFWLSFVAVALLMASGDGAWVQATVSADPGRWSRWKAWVRQSVGVGLRTQAIATVGLAPLTLIFFQQVSVVGFVANLVAIPIVTLVVTPLAMLGMAAAPCWDLAALAVRGLSLWLEWLARWPLAEVLTAAAPVWAMGVGVAGAVLAVLPGPRGLRAFAMLLLLPLLWPPAPRPASGAFEVIALDVGQGTAVLVRTAHHTLVYDTGPVYSADSDAGRRVLLPVLQALGERQVDLLMLSHRDIDHVGGAQAMLARYPATPVSSSLEEGHELLRSMATHEPCRAGQRWQWDGVDFEVLHPGPHDQAPPLKPNQVSCVLRVSGAGHSALLTGDIEQGEEARLVAQWGEALAADLLIVPHHGSKTSSTPDFLDVVQPRVAVFQAAYRSRFGHPAREVWERYAERGIERIATPACGAYRWSQGQGRCERDLRPRYWHHARRGA
jgi:competence protein ComEC